MLRTRIVPALLLRNGGLVKTVKFDRPQYVGDPINAVRIFNDKEVDELVFLDITATPTAKGPNFELLADIASEAFMPFGYGGGITTLDQIKRLFQLGIEKVILNSALASDPGLVGQAAALAGSSSVVVSIDVKKSFLGRYSVCTHSGRSDLRRDPAEYAAEMARRGAGEILLTAIDRDGAQVGYDLDLVARVSAAVSVPIVACGGAGKLEDFHRVVDAGASAAAAGSMFVFHGRHRAVLITYPEYSALEALFAQ
jgi:cyclase